MKHAESRWTRCEFRGCFAVRFPGQRYCYWHWMVVGTASTAVVIAAALAAIWALAYFWGW